MIIAILILLAINTVTTGLLFMAVKFSADQGLVWMFYTMFFGAFCVIGLHVFAFGKLIEPRNKRHATVIVINEYSFTKEVCSMYKSLKLNIINSFKGKS